MSEDWLYTHPSLMGAFTGAELERLANQPGAAYIQVVARNVLAGDSYGGRLVSASGADLNAPAATRFGGISGVRDPTGGPLTPPSSAGDVSTPELGSSAMGIAALVGLWFLTRR